jgi:hypothetical protein
VTSLNNCTCRELVSAFECTELKFDAAFGTTFKSFQRSNQKLYSSTRQAKNFKPFSLEQIVVI